MLCFVSFIFFSFLSLLGAQTPGSTPGPWGGVGGVGWVCIRKSQRPVKSQQPVPALWEVRSTGARALGGGEPVGQARAGLSGWSFLALEAPRASRTLLDCESKYRPKNFTFSLRVRGNARWGVGAAAGAVGARGGGGSGLIPGRILCSGVGRRLPWAAGLPLEKAAYVCSSLGPVGETDDRKGK